MNEIDNFTNNTNIKLTSARKSILEKFIIYNKPLSYDDIKEDLNMDKATFYRNIAIFEKEDIVESFESNDKKRYYEISKNKHSHFICNVCSKIECIHEEIDVNLKNYQVNTIVIKGICLKCLENKKEISND